MEIEAPKRGRKPVDDEPILQLLAKRMDATAVAAALGCSPTTVYKRLRDPLFNARLHERRACELSEPAKAATDLVSEALNTLAVVMRTGEEKSQVQAAKTVVELALRLRAETDILPRLAALEAALAEKGIELPLPVGKPESGDSGDESGG